MKKRIMNKTILIVYDDEKCRKAIEILQKRII